MEINGCEGIREKEKDQCYLFKLEANYQTPKTEEKKVSPTCSKKQKGRNSYYFILDIYWD